MQSIGNYLYNPREILGSGGFGTVYKGYHSTKPNMIVAVKCIENNIQLINNEIGALKRLNVLKNENIVSFYDALSVHQHRAPKVYIIMEYCNGGDLAKYLAVKGKLPETTIRFFLQQLANGMQAILKMGVFHRDLKPQNILITYKTNVRMLNTMILKISDFGISRFLANGQNANTFIGTLAYMAPEVKNRQPYNVKADMWSLGVIVYQCLTSEIFNGHFRISGRTSKELESLLVGLLQRNVAKRFNFNDFINHIFFTGLNYR